MSSDPKPILCDKPGCTRSPEHSYMIRVNCEATLYNKAYNRLVVVRCCAEHTPNGIH